MEYTVDDPGSIKQKYKASYNYVLHLQFDDYLYQTICSTSSLKVYYIYWNTGIYVGIFDVFCVVIEKLVGKGSSTCLEHE